MSRWQPDARGRLQAAAMELYAEHGFEETTVAEIAVRAGLTERTFFRHFSDKREVLFFGQDQLQELFVSTVALEPAGAAPLDMVAAALNAVAEEFGPRRPYSTKRQGVIDANPALQERELAKLAHLTSAIASALRERGVLEPTASLTANVCISVFRVSFQQWVAAGNTASFQEIVIECLAALKAVAADA